MPINTEHMDHEEMEWVEMRNKAKAKQEASHKNNPLSEKEWDDIRRRQAEASIAAARAKSVTPATLTNDKTHQSPFDIDLKVSIPTPNNDPDRKTLQITGQTPAPSVASPLASINPQQNKTADNYICLWECKMDHTVIYAPSWDVLKEKLKHSAGLWTAKEHKFANTIDNILGFFVPEQYDTLNGDTVKSFDIIVQNGKVFKGE
jgi:hypothetical protein